MSTHPTKTAEVFFGDDTPWYCAGCGDEIKRGDEMLVFYCDGHRVEIHRGCIPPRAVLHPLRRHRHGPADDSSRFSPMRRADQ